MKRILFAFMLLAAACMEVFSQNQPPCNYSISFGYTRSGDSINFSAASSPVADGFYRWSFGDGSGAYGSSVSHLYNTSGKYRVCLYFQTTRSNQIGDSCFAVYCDSVIVQRRGCTATATISASQNGNTVTFTGNGTPEFRGYYFWDFGDGSVNDGQTVTHHYSSPGQYTACLRYSAKTPNWDSCIAYTCYTVVIPNQNCNLSASFSTSSAGLATKFFATGSPAYNPSYRWDFGDGSIGWGQNAFHYYSFPGKYVACLTYFTNQYNTPFDTCSITYCDTVTVEQTNCNLSASFTVNQSGGFAQFYGNGYPSSNGYYEWNFGDGNYGWGQSPNHIYNASGDYPVCLTYYRINPNAPHDTCRATYCDTITVARPDCNLSASFTVNQSGGFAQFNGNGYPSSNGYYEWNFGDGNYGWGQSPYHIYNASGDYLVCLTYYRINPNAPHDTCRVTYCDTITVERTDCNVTAGFYSTRSGNTVTFIGTSSQPGGYFVWELGDGSVEFGEIVSHTFPDSGWYNVCVNYITHTNQIDTCKATFCDSIYIQPNGCNVNTFFSSSQIGNTVNFYGVSSQPWGTYVWNFGDGQYAYGENVSHVFSTGGYKTVCVTYSVSNPNGLDSCSATYCDSIYVEPSCNISVDFTSTRVGNTFSFDGNGSYYFGNYFWSFDDESFAHGEKVEHTFNSSGWHQVCVYYSLTMPNSGDSCTASFCDSIYIQRPPCNVSTSFTSSQSGRTVNFNGTGSIFSGQYFWDFGDGITGTGKNVSHVYAASGNYTVCLTYKMINPNSPGDTCTAQYCSLITIQKPACNVSASFTSNEFGKTVSFYGKSVSGFGGTYIWHFGDGNTGTGKNVIHSYDSAGTYIVCLTYLRTRPNSLDTCVSYYCDTITVAPSGCQVTATFTDTVKGKTVYLQAFTNTSKSGLYKWNFGDGKTQTSFSPVTSHTYASAGSYVITLDFYLLNIHGTCTASYSDSIYVAPQKPNNPNIYVYPMPVSDRLYYQIPGVDVNGASASIEILNGFGYSVKKEETLSNEGIDVQSLPAGVYILRIIYNNTVYSKQFLKN